MSAQGEADAEIFAQSDRSSEKPAHRLAEKNPLSRSLINRVYSAWTKPEAETPRKNALVVWLFFFAVFSKIFWYDLRIYLPPAQRRFYITALFAIWILAQLAIYLPVLPQMVRRFRGVVWFWIIAVGPYIALGLIHGRANTLLLGDIARYATPVGFLLFGLWAVNATPVRTLLTAATATLGFWMALRTGLHLYLSTRLLRYGVQWEVLFPFLLAALALTLSGWRYAAILVLICLVAFSIALGQTRSTLLGTGIGAGIVGLIALAGLRAAFGPNLRMGAAAAVAIVAAFTPMVVPSAMFARVNLGKVVTESNPELMAEIGENIAGGQAATPRTTAKPGSAAQNPTPGSSAPDAGKRAKPAPRIAKAHAQWERAIAGGNRSMDVRIAESAYFLELFRADWKSLLLGVGGGDFVTVATPWSGDRVVRGAHNTYVTLLYRHGAVLGIALILFVSFAGLWTNIRQLQSATDLNWRILLTALIAYRGAVLVMAQLHQGLFDDPIVFLSIAIAGAAPASTARAARPEGDNVSAIAASPA